MVENKVQQYKMFGGAHVMYLKLVVAVRTDRPACSFVSGICSLVILHHRHDLEFSLGFLMLKRMP